VEVAGAGTRLPARRLRPDRLRAKVHEAIRLGEGARRIQQGFAAMTSAPAPATTNDKPTSHEAHDHGWSTRLGR
jgi:UDP:flavonoid glycosyltransferase YjiC (YdhE family)